MTLRTEDFSVRQRIDYKVSHIVTTATLLKLLNVLTTSFDHYLIPTSRPQSHSNASNFGHSLQRNLFMNAIVHTTSTSNSTHTYASTQYSTISSPTTPTNNIVITLLAFSSLFYISTTQTPAIPHITALTLTTTNTLQRSNRLPSPSIQCRRGDNAHTPSIPGWLPII